LVDPFFILLRSLGSGFFLKDEEIPETRPGGSVLVTAT
jgi:hypothetical protein